jgi:phenylacetate-CoA ligase
VTHKLQRFRRLVRFAAANSPYYAALIAKRDIDVMSCTPVDFPVLDKKTLMASFDDIVTDRRITKQVVADFLSRSSDPAERLFDKYTVLHTSGTSGEVGYFLSTNADGRRMSRGMSRRRRTAGWRRRGSFRLNPLKRTRLAFYGATGGHFAGVTAIARLQHGLPRLFIDAKAFEVNLPLSDIRRELDEFRPGMLLGYTTALKILGEEQKAGRLNISPASIVATGETASKADLRFLSSAFDDAHAISVYACTEHMMMGYSNPDGETMTLLDDNLFFEFRDDHSLVTNLGNYTLPLIRYRMSDILRPISPPDAQDIIVSSLVGRSEQMPQFTNENGETDFISPHTINEIFVKGVTRFQFQITGQNSFRFPICVDPSLSEQQRAEAADAIGKRLQEILDQKRLTGVRFDVPIVDDIPINPKTRKFQLIVRVNE